MQFHTLLILFTSSFFIIATQNAANQNLKNRSTSKDRGTIEDTPSPEWIKYQQERFQNSDKIFSTQQNVLKSSATLDTNPAVVKEETSQWETYSRRDDAKTLQNKMLPVEYENSEETFEEKTNSAVQFPSIKGFIEFIKSIKQTWRKSSLFRIEDKIKMLHQLKDSLLKTIESQFKVLWQDDEDDEEQIISTERKLQTKISKHIHGSHLRSKRGILDESSINFPPDAALISINFLTFAVFLIKLVLQVVNIIKTKHYQFSTLNMNTGVIRNG